MKRIGAPYLDLCDDPAFRRVVLIDGPSVLGRERWADSPVSTKARDSFAHDAGDSAGHFRQTLRDAVFMGAFTAAALTIAEAEDIEMAKVEAQQLMSALFAQLRDL